mmetsp:Transcript_21471/g.45888  ORF Transcript_21471/g.45888 Transcript_21471/m.45888 type:complete len:607 (-) Transcript_21471:76-1896(-)|eukprot:CAMPEP_0172527804 /NCGR_PEP_ID=MMETSP1067-20121228/2381_1 /TAXON_ID=265564 ORGANISM="Thalassiosira punctigera, Strain Tpunct2005C2" /NCGR_SAMPLE_ID=MMETSP1067 /ASSEMBLY_ACC=CAM_ASM_000444 /LENGTH=606 /DNA_ID=CAMNT_0013311611 /DNA_START=75 /DNA_END=1895 /DNA_ORIENTATION=+
MKPSTVAVALLTAPLGAVTNGQQVGGGGPAPQYKRMKTIRGQSSPRARLLTGEAGTDEAELLTTCGALKAGGDCNSNESCTWCVAGAVPSACYPSEMTSRLPEGVFDCGAKQAKANLAEVAASQIFYLKEGVTLTLDTAEVDKDFCDASSPLSLAGYMNVKGSQFDTKSDKNLFYWFFEKRMTSQLPAGNPKLQSGWPWSKKKETPKEKPSKKDENAEEKPTSPEETPFVVWLTGGPGCSSSLALLSENGPCSVNSDGATTKVNPYSWTESANVLWLDQPADVGYSYGQGNDSNEEMISEDAYYFLQAFFKSKEGRKYKDSPLFIVGESYGGHYAPAIAHRIWRGNKDLKDGLAALNLKGVAVGNGLTDPEEQYKWYAEMAYKNPKGIEVINEQTYNMMTEALPMCTAGIHQCNKGDGMLNSFACQAAFLFCNTALTTPYRASGKNPYDITKECGLDPLCYDFSHIEDFMNKDSTKQALHVDKRNPSWKTCNMMINMSFHVDWMKNFAPYVADMLNDGIPALIYAGDLDFVCNYMGNREWTLNLNWDHNAEFKSAEEHDWNDGAGMARTSNGLTFLQVYDAGHMVPSDQPEHSLRMITQFLNGEAF